MSLLTRANSPCLQPLRFAYPRSFCPFIVSCRRSLSVCIGSFPWMVETLLSARLSVITMGATSKTIKHTHLANPDWWRAARLAYSLHLSVSLHFLFDSVVEWWLLLVQETTVRPTDYFLCSITTSFSTSANDCGLAPHPRPTPNRYETVADGVGVDWWWK